MPGILTNARIPSFKCDATPERFYLLDSVQSVPISGWGRLRETITRWKWLNYLYEIDYLLALMQQNLNYLRN